MDTAHKRATDARMASSAVMQALAVGMGDGGASQRGTGAAQIKSTVQEKMRSSKEGPGMTITAQALAGMGENAKGGKARTGHLEGMVFVDMATERLAHTIAPKRGILNLHSRLVAAQLRDLHLKIWRAYHAL